MNVQRLLHPIQARRWMAKCHAPWPTLRAPGDEQATGTPLAAPRGAAADLGTSPSGSAALPWHHWRTTKEGTTMTIRTFVRAAMLGLGAWLATLPVQVVIGSAL